MSTLAVFQLYCGVCKLYILFTHYLEVTGYLLYNSHRISNPTFNRKKIIKQIALLFYSFIKKPTDF